MSRLLRLSCLALVLAPTAPPARGDDRPAAPGGGPSRVYGEWRIRVRPDQGPAYERLIERSGLPLFRAGGGRMVGWWKTLVGDLYEQVTVWEYDGLAAYERAVATLSKDPEFARFAAARDPLLAGEESRFLRPAPGAAPPRLADPAPFVVHEVHRVPLARRDAYLAFMTGRGLGLLRSHGFRPVGPWVVDLGRWTEVTYLFRFEGLAERERLMAEFGAQADGRAYGAEVGGLVEEVTTRLLVPAPFAAPAAPGGGAEPKPAAAGPPLPHREEVAPGVFAAGFADRHGSANCGWAAVGGETLLVDLPRGLPAPEFLALVAATTGRPARTAALTQVRPGDAALVRALLRGGVDRVLASPGARAALVAADRGLDTPALVAVAERAPVGAAAAGGAEFLPLDGVAAPAGAAVLLADRGVLFAGPLAVHGPRTRLAGGDTALWASTLRRLEAPAPARVVPGVGSWGGPDVLARQRRFLTEVRRQVGHHVALGRPRADLPDPLPLPADLMVWMPYDTPTAEDLDHVYRELTVPSAPFGGRPPAANDPRPHALVLIGDGPHEPGHIEEGLPPAFEAAGVVPHVTVDVRALSAENLARVRLLVVLRDGLQRPGADARSHRAWMTPAQERAVVAFVEGGGGLLNLHNALGLYPEGGPYLDLLGGRYTTHGPLERFRVEVVDPGHPVTRGVGAYFVADEQHAPVCDEGRVHLLLRSRSDDGTAAAAGWVREAGRGRVCHLANGHTREALLHPTFQTLLRNAARWCARGGAG